MTCMSQAVALVLLICGNNLVSCRRTKNCTAYNALEEFFPRDPVDVALFYRNKAPIDTPVQQALRMRKHTPNHYPSRGEISEVLYNGTEVYAGIPAEFQSFGFQSTAQYHGPVYQSYIKRILGDTPKFMLEVGSFIGMGAVHTWGPLAASGNGVVLCVDSWQGDVNMRLGSSNKFRSESSFTQAMRLRNGLPQLAWTFLKNVVAKNLTKVLLPLAMPSLTAARLLALLPWTIDVIYLDSAHEGGETLLELHMYYRLLRPGGILMGDDYKVFPAVKQDVDYFAFCKGLRVEYVRWRSRNHEWVIRKPL